MMKKVGSVILAVASLAAAMLMLASCNKDKVDLSSTATVPPDGQTVNESAINAERGDTISGEIGKCEKNKKIVYKRSVDSSQQLRSNYEVIFLVDDTGANNYKLTYEYFNKADDYNSQLAYYQKTEENVVKFDPAELLVVTRTENFKIITDEIAEKGTFEGCDVSAATLYSVAVNQLKADDKVTVIE